MLLPFQGATAPTRDTQGVASLALGYVLRWPFRPPLQGQNGCLSFRNGKSLHDGIPLPKPQCTALQITII